MSLIVITGGTRSGKTSWAEKLAAKMAAEQGVIYLATAEALDKEMEERVQLHRESRPRHWLTIEAPTQLATALQRQEGVGLSTVLILDCVTMLVNNLMAGPDAIANAIEDTVGVEQAVRDELHGLIRFVKENHMMLIAVTNEVGGGIVPANALARSYRDVTGRTNQWLAGQAEEVWYLVSGLALPLHQLGIR